MLRRVGVLLFLAGCSSEPKGAPVDPPPGLEQMKLGERSGAWSGVAAAKLGLDSSNLGQMQWWVRPGAVEGQLAEALTAMNNAIAVDRQCMTDGTAACKTGLIAYAPSLDGLGPMLLWRRSLSDDLGEKGAILVAMGAYRPALRTLDEALLSGDHPYHHRFRGDALRGLKRYEEAATEYRLANEKNGVAVLWLLEGLADLQAKHPELAKPLVDKALAKDPSLRDSVPGAAELLAQLSP